MKFREHLTPTETTGTILSGNTEAFKRNYTNLSTTQWHGEKSMFVHLLTKLVNY